MSKKVGVVSARPHAVASAAILNVRLPRATCQTRLSDMTTTLREFSRNLARHRRAAANGREIIVQDGGGATYVFKRIEVRAVGGHLVVERAAAG